MALHLRIDSSGPASGSVDRSARPIRQRQVALPRDLQRTIDAVRQMQNRSVTAVTIRDDCRQLRVTLDGEDVVLMSVDVGAGGEARLDADLLSLGTGV